jgi:redox-sensing transcriptional repressor
VADLIQAVRRILGTHREWPVALVGFGNLGRALVGYRGFRRQGFSICAIFDVDPGKIGQSVDSIRIEPIASLARRVNEQKIELGIIAVPAESAQSVVDALVAAGVCGILNFAPALLSVPEHLSVISVDLAVHLEMLSYQVQTSRA